MPCVQKTTGLRSATALPTPAKRPAALRRTQPTSVPRAHYPCLAHPVARSGLPPPEQNTRPRPGLFNTGLQCGFAHYESLYCWKSFSFGDVLVCFTEKCSAGIGKEASVGKLTLGSGITVRCPARCSGGDAVAVAEADRSHAECLPLIHHSYFLFPTSALTGKVHTQRALCPTACVC
jgi:hypothetical protein